MLQICDQLYLAHKITENQLLYLRHLVLIREEVSTYLCVSLFIPPLLSMTIRGAEGKKEGLKNGWMYELICG